MEIKKHTNLQSTADMLGGPIKVSKITTGVIAMIVFQLSHKSEPEPACIQTNPARKKEKILQPAIFEQF